MSLTTRCLLLSLLPLSGCGGGLEATVNDFDEPALDSAEAPLALSCTFGQTCASPLTVLAATGPKGGPSGNTLNATYWYADAIAGRNVPRVAKTISLTGLRLERDDLSVWLSSTADGTGALAADDVLLVEVRSSGGSVLTRQILAGPRLLLSDHSTEVPSRPSAWNGELNGYAAPAFDLAPLLPRDRTFTLKISVLDLQGLTANASVQLVVKPKVVAPPVLKEVADLFDPAVHGASSTAAPSELVRFFAPGAQTSSPFKSVLVERHRTCNSVTGCTPWAAGVGTTLNSSMSVLSEVQAMPFRFDLGEINRGYVLKLAVARAWNIQNTLFFSTLTTVTNTRCVNAVAGGSEETCFWFPFEQVKVTSQGVWAISNLSIQPYGSGAREERQFAVFARFDGQEVPVATFARETWSVRW
jgi:hypothetical protein